MHDKKLNNQNKTKNIIMEILFLTICVAVIAILYALSIGVWLSDIKKQMNSLL